ncbi:MAG: YceI family protein [Bdellovibrionales bacterium]
MRLVRSIRPLLSFLAIAMLASLALILQPAAPTQAESDARPALVSGTYQLDPNHTSVTFRVLHMGFSRFTGRFDKIEGTMNFNANAPEQSGLDITVYPNSVNANNVKLEEELRGDKWFNVLKFQRATFHGVKIERAGPAAAKITGEFTLMGVTKPLTLDVALIGSGEHPMLKKPVLGFSATATIRRSDFGLTNYLPMIGDEVTLQIETEFNKAD